MLLLDMLASQEMHCIQVTHSVTYSVSHIVLVSQPYPSDESKQSRMLLGPLKILWPLQQVLALEPIVVNTTTTLLLPIEKSISHSVTECLSACHTLPLSQNSQGSYYKHQGNKANAVTIAFSSITFLTAFIVTTVNREITTNRGTLRYCNYYNYKYNCSRSIIMVFTAIMVISVIIAIRSFTAFFSSKWPFQLCHQSHKRQYIY